MPINYKTYPPNWKETRQRILSRANHRCEFCGIQNHAIGFRDADGTFYEEDGSSYIPDSALQGNVFKIVLTIAHLDHDETNWNVQDDRLAALCQRCHLQYDAKEKARRRNEKRNRNQLTIFK